MSEYHSTTTKFNDEETLVNALVDCGYDRSKIEVHAEAQQLFDYTGRATTYLDKSGDKANIIVRSKNIGYGSANDLGFKFNPATKTYDAIVSQYDTSRWGASSDRMRKMKVAYTEHRTIKAGKKAGFKFLGKDIVNGKPQLKWLDTKAGN
jgi:hypothetical protein